jgi:DNA adenine methylase
MIENPIPEQLTYWTDTSKVVNVASVKQRSPFRYPGGKTWLVPRIFDWLRNMPKPQKFIEPFAGGAIIGLTVVFENLAEQVVLIEKDEQVAAVWKTIVSDKGGAEWLAEKIVSFHLTIDTAQKVLTAKPKNMRERAFQTILQNRISHGGILAPGAGMLKNGENGRGILSRWYPETLKKRILAIGQVRERIQFVKGDGIEFIQRSADNVNAVFFIDPPYTASTKKAGTRLYKHHQLDHDRLFQEVSRVRGEFLMTYDDAEEVRDLARNYRFDFQTIAMSNTHHATMNELLISRNLSWLGQ